MNDVISTPLRILAVDDDRVGLRLLESLLKREGHQVTTAVDGESAIEAFARERPDLVLMDVLMPGMTGLEAAAEIRRRSGDAWVPLIFISAASDRESLIAGFQAGGDAYITKPFDPFVLRAKLAAFERIAQLQLKLRLRNAELGVHRDRLERERDLALHVMARLLQTGEPENPAIWQRVWPASMFSGDLTLAQRAPGGVWHVLVADACGKGLAAALTAYPVVELFRAMSRLGYSIGSIAARLNDTLSRNLPPGRFVAATLISFDARADEIRVWSGGNPPPVFLSDDGAIVQRWEAAHPPLGLVDRDLFEDTVEVYRFDRPGTLLAWTDGLTEHFAAEGCYDDEAILDRLATEIRRGGSSDLAPRVAAALESHRAVEQDDVALISIRSALAAAAAELGEPCSEDPKSEDSSQARWSLALRLGPNELRNVDPVPLTLTWLEQLGLSQDIRSTLFVVLSELMTNAVDHGLLGLDSAMKDEADGFARYLELRRARLDALDDGSVAFELEGNGATMILRIVDSGGGFDYRRWLTEEDRAEKRRRGRGIALVRGLSTSLNYMGRGNSAEVRVSFEDHRAEDIHPCPNRPFRPTERPECWPCSKPADELCAASKALAQLDLAK